VRLTFSGISCDDGIADYDGWNYQYCSVLGPNDPRIAPGPECAYTVAAVFDPRYPNGATPGDPREECTYNVEFKPMRPPHMECCPIPP
jgi:hypothetical protein